MNRESLKTTIKQTIAIHEEIRKLREKNPILPLETEEEIRNKLDFHQIAWDDIGLKAEEYRKKLSGMFNRLLVNPTLRKESLTPEEAVLYEITIEEGGETIAEGRTNSDTESETENRNQNQDTPQNNNTERERILAIVESRKDRRTTLYCTTCHRWGHKQDECKKGICFICEQKGHRIQECEYDTRGDDTIRVEKEEEKTWAQKFSAENQTRVNTWKPMIELMYEPIRKDKIYFPTNEEIGTMIKTYGGNPNLVEGIDIGPKRATIIMETYIAVEEIGNKKIRSPINNNFMLLSSRIQGRRDTVVKIKNVDFKVSKEALESLWRNSWKYSIPDTENG